MHLKWTKKSMLTRCWENYISCAVKYWKLNPLEEFTETEQAEVKEDNFFIIRLN